MLWNDFPDLRADWSAAWFKLLPVWSGPFRWSKVTGPLGATISVLLDLGWGPARPDLWFSPSPSSRRWDIGETNGPLLAAIACSASQQVWQHASKHWSGAGLQDGADLTVARRHLKKLADTEAGALRGLGLAVVTAAMWPRARQVQDGKADNATCLRCGAGTEDDFHVVWGCSCNSEIKDPIMELSDGLKDMAKAGQENAACFWNRGIPPKKWTTIEPAASDLSEHVMGTEELWGPGNYASDA